VKRKTNDFIVNQLRRDTAYFRHLVVRPLCVAQSTQRIFILFVSLAWRRQSGAEHVSHCYAVRRRHVEQESVRASVNPTNSRFIAGQTVSKIVRFHQNVLTTKNRSDA